MVLPIATDPAISYRPPHVSNQTPDTENAADTPPSDDAKTAVKPPQHPRRLKLYQRDFDPSMGGFGYTDGCARCDHAVKMVGARLRYPTHQDVSGESRANWPRRTAAGAAWRKRRNA